MRRRVKKLARIARFYEQKKRLRIVDFHKAEVDSFLKAQGLASAVARRNEFVRDNARKLSGSIDVAEFARMDTGRAFHREGVERMRTGLEAARGVKSAKRDAVVRAARRSRIWETLVSNSEEQLRKSETARSEKISDDLALLKAGSKKLP